MRRERTRADARRLRRARISAAAAATVATAALAAAPGAGAATIQVANNNDSGPGSFRQAVTDANLTKAADTITFAPNVTGTITLTSGSVNAKYDTTIDGPGADVLTIRAPTPTGDDVLSASNINYASEVQNFEVEGLTLVSEEYRAFVGYTGFDSVTIRDCELQGNSIFGGGGISDLGVADFKVVDSKVTGSTAATAGGGIYADDSKLTITGSQVTGNENETNGAGGGIYATDTELTIVDSRVADNEAPGGVGGGIAVFDAAGGKVSSLSVRDSVIADNNSLNEGGGIAVAAAEGPVSISRSTVSGNFSPGLGAGLYIGYTGAVSVDSSTFLQNGGSGSYGGGMTIFAPRGSFELSNSTVTDNHGKRGAGVYWINYYDEPGAIRNSTIVGNGGSVAGGGVFRYAFDGTGAGFEGPDELTISSSVVSGNTAPMEPDLGQRSGGSGSFITDHSLVGATDATATLTDGGGNKLNAGVTGVEALGDNGGPTLTMLPDASGPLIDAGAANGLTSDQRGLARTAQKPPADAAGSDGTDIGAVELADAELIDPFARAARKQKVKGKVKVVVEVGAGEIATGTATGSVKLGKKKLPLGEVSASLEPGATEKLTLKPGSKKAGKKIQKALKKGKKAKASVAVTIADGSGHESTTDLGVKLKGKKKRKK